MMLMNLEKQRQSAQLQFVQSQQNIVVGSLTNFPLTLEQLKNTTANSSYVIESFENGLTAVVYHLRLQGQDWTLKCKRAESLVKNVDGQTSFLNEVQRRADLMALKAGNSMNFNSIIDTQFASFQDGIILSPWIFGNEIQVLDENTFEQIFTAIVNLELSGLFEWDFCPGNILQTPEHDIRLFDFGYMYQFDPKTQFNSNGTDTPLFHGIERFETRCFFDYLLKAADDMTSQEEFVLYRLEKRCALAAYQRKLNKLIELGATSVVIEHQRSTNALWQASLSSDNMLGELLIVEKFRSNVLDLMDDVHGKSCSPFSIKKADLILSMLEQHFQLLASKQGFFFGDEVLSQAELVTKYQQMKLTAINYQLG